MPLPETPPSLLDNLSDSLVNAFTKVRKPDERFLEMKDGIEKFEEGMSNVERLLAKERARTEGECRCAQLNDQGSMIDSFSNRSCAGLRGLGCILPRTGIPRVRYHGASKPIR